MPGARHLQADPHHGSWQTPVMTDDGARRRQAFIDSVANRVLGPRLHTASALADAVGLTVDEIEPVWMELGFTPADRSLPLFSDRDLAVLRLLLSTRHEQLVSDETAVAMARVLGQALARVAATQAQAIAPAVHQLASACEDPQPVQLDGGLTVSGLDELADMVADLLVPTMDEFIAYTWRRHLVAALQRHLQARTSEVVGFADLVGFTRLSSQIDVEEVPELVNRFQELATRQLVPHDGRVVKTIGDAVLFVFPDGHRAALGTLGLLAACRAEPSLPDIRAGLASGPVAEVEGDVYGDTVNRAARLVELARPATVLADEDTAVQLFDDPDIVVRPLRPRRLKGLGYVRSWAVRSRSEPA